MLVRDYVTGQDHMQYSQLPDGVVAICLTHSNLSAKHLDIRLDLHMTIADAKEKFRTHIGTPAEHQRLHLLDQGRMICEMSDNNRMLGFYSVASGMEIHVVDTDPFSLSRGGGLTDTTLVEKYKMSDEAYEKRSGTMREYIKQKRVNDPTFKLPNAKPKPMAAETDEGLPPGAESVEGMAVGNRCQIMPGARRGTVAFVGEIAQLKAGHWVGVRLDEPLGKSNGTAQGVTIFECGENFGAFVRGKNVTVGDFPERDLMDDDDCEDKENGKDDEDEDEI